MPHRLLPLFAVGRADIEGFARELEARGRARAQEAGRIGKIWTDAAGWRACGELSTALARQNTRGPALGDASGLSCCLRALARVSLSIGIAGLPNVGKSTLFMRDGDVVEFRFAPNCRSHQACRYFQQTSVNWMQENM